MSPPKGKSPGKKLVIPAGMVFGFLKTVRQDFSQAVRAFFCECILCGAVRSYRLGNLRSGNSTSCGCQNEPKNKSRGLIGKVFGTITLTREVEKRTFEKCEQSQRRFEGKCVCGRVGVYLLSNLKKLKKDGPCPHHRKAWNKGLKTGAVPWNKQDIPVGKTFTRLTVRGEGPKAPGKTRVWCGCSCGKKVIVDLSKLRNGHTKSCGCLLNGPAWNREDMSRGKRLGTHTVDVEFVRYGERWVRAHCNRGVAHEVSVRTLRKRAKKNPSDCSACFEKERSEIHRWRRRLTNRINKQVRRVLSGLGLSKAGRETFAMLGYPESDAFLHLSKDLGCLCKECHGVILTLGNSQVDHIKPLRLAKTEADVIMLNQLPNLRMICARCNHKKGGKF